MNYRVLVIDDDPDICDVLCSILARERLLTEKGSSGQDCIRLLSDGTCFDLVLLDMRMPVFTGLQTLNMIRQLPGPMKKVPVCFVSGSADQAVISEVARLEIAGYLLKPFDTEQIIDKVRNVLPLPISTAEIRGLLDHCHHPDDDLANCLASIGLKNRYRAYPVTIGKRSFAVFVDQTLNPATQSKASDVDLSGKVAVFQRSKGRWQFQVLAAEAGRDVDQTVTRDRQKIWSALCRDVVAG